MARKPCVRWRQPTSVFLALLLPIQLIPTPLTGHNEITTAVDHTAPDEYQVTRPMACPLHLTGGFLRYFFGYEHEGYVWTDQWEREAVIDPVHRAIAEYVPPGDPLYIVSRDGKARWYHPRLTVRCTVTEWWSRGRIVRARDSYKVTHNGGNVVECGGGGGSGWELAENADPYASTYDPYSMGGFSGGDGGCTGIGDGTDSGGGTDTTGGGTQYQPGDYTGGETVDWGTGVGNGGTSECGLAAQVEFVCIDEYDAETDEWENWGCGWVTTC